MNATNLPDRPQRLPTGHATFSPVGPVKDHLHLFQVTPGIDADHALNKASELLAEVRELLLDAAMGAPLGGAKAWLTVHALESSKAIIDALLHEVTYPSNATQV